MLLAASALVGCVSNRSTALDAVPLARGLFGPEYVERRAAAEREYVCRYRDDCPYPESLFVRRTGIPEADSYWRPDSSAFQAFDRAAAAALEHDRRRFESDPPGELADYCVQYLGVVRSGRRMLVAQGHRFLRDGVSCGDLDRGWFVIYDGGTSVFTALFDLESRQMESFYYNGSA